MKTTHSKVMTIANRLVAQGISRAQAMVKAWALAHALYLTVARYSYQGLIQEFKTPEAAFNYTSNLGPDQ